MPHLIADLVDVGTLVFGLGELRPGTHERREGAEERAQPLLV
ncbi:hypothetical protein WMF30_31545 [Sorangium sp. So ce134]